MEIKFLNQNLQNDIEKLKSFDQPVEIQTSYDDSQDTTFYELMVNDESYFYYNESDMEIDARRLGILLNNGLIVIPINVAIECMVDADLMALTVDPYDSLKNIVMNGWTGYNNMTSFQIMERYNEMFDKSNIIEECIEKFLISHTTLVTENENGAYVDAMMDINKCIEYLGKQYYLPKSYIGYTKEEEIIREYLVDNFQVI